MRVLCVCETLTVYHITSIKIKKKKKTEMHLKKTKTKKKLGTLQLSVLS